MHEWMVRPAVEADWPSLQGLIVTMFAELGTTEIPAGWSANLRQCVTDRLGHDVAVFVAVDGQDRPVAAAFGVIDHRLPSPRRPSGDIGYVEWLATHPEHRRRGAARAVMTALLKWIDDRAAAVDVHASLNAEPLYRELGFHRPTAVPMRRSSPR